MKVVLCLCLLICDFTTRAVHAQDQENEKGASDEHWCQRRLQDTQVKDRIHSFIQDTMGCAGMANLAVTVVDCDGAEAIFTFGDRDMQSGVSVDGDTRFGIGSVSKGFTSTLGAIASEKLAAEGSANNMWITPVTSLDREGRLFPSHTLNDSVSDGRVTPRDLCSHMTGVPRNDGMWYFGTANETHPGMDLPRKLRYLPPSTDFRLSPQYNNLMVASAAQLFSTLLGHRSLSHALHRELFEPLNMTSTTVSIDEALTSNNYAFPYVFVSKEDTWLPLKRDINRVLDEIAGAGGITSTPRDMAKWIRFQLNAGKGDSGDTLVKQSSLDYTRYPHAGLSIALQPDVVLPDFPASFTYQAMGLGWMPSMYRGSEAVWHAGETIGHHSLLWLMPHTRQRVGVFLSSSAGGTNAYNVEQGIAWYISDLLLGNELWLTPKDICQWPCSFVNCTSGAHVTIHEPHREATTMHSIMSQHPTKVFTPPYFTSPQAGAESSVRVRPGRYVHPAFGALTISDENIQSLRFRNLTATLHDMSREAASEVISMYKDPISSNLTDRGFLGQQQLHPMRMEVGPPYDTLAKAFGSQNSFVLLYDIPNNTILMPILESTVVPRFRFLES